MLFKIIWRSFLRQTRNYIVYFLCMMTSVMIFYSFSAMTYDQPLTRRARQDIQIEGVLTLGNIVVAVVILIFMLSANQFFVQQRQKEIGLYQLFGLRKSRILYQFLVEAVVLNIVSLIVGILMGMVFSKFFAMILIKAMALDINSRFFISWPSIVTTVVMFLIALGFISVQNMLLIWQKQLIELFTQKNDFSSRRLRMHWSAYFTAGLSILLIGTGYYIAVNFNEVLGKYIQETGDSSAFLWIPLLIFALCVFGTYLFFGQGLQVLLFLIGKWRKYSYRQLRFFVLNDTRKLLQKSWRTLSLISVIVGIAISMIGGALGVFAVTFRMMELNYPVDFQVTSESAYRLEQLIQRNGGTLSQKLVLPLKVTGAQALRRNELAEQEFYSDISVVDILSEKEYQRLRHILPESPEVAIQDSNGAVLFNPMYSLNNELVSYQKKISLTKDLELDVEQSYPDFIGDNLLRYGTLLLVVKEEIYEQIEGLDYQIVYMNAHGYNQERFQQNYVTQFPTEWGNEISYHYVYQNGQLHGELETSLSEENKQLEDWHSISRLNQSSRYPNVRSARRQGGIFLYVALFVGMIVLITTASSLMVRQFFQAGREKKKYQLLQQMGIPKQNLHRTVYRQNAWIFFPPMLIAISHGSFAIYMLTQLVQDTSYWIAYLFCFITLFIFTAAYFLTTTFYLRIVEEK
ncbi:FtsX-like permease family protein [Enterococcus olivae]